MVILIFISTATLLSIYKIWKTKKSNRLFKDSQELEIIWTVVPSIILLSIGLPSLRLLYVVDESEIASITVKALGHQWYWHYDYPDVTSFDSYIVNNNYRLLDVDNRLIVPVSHAVRMLITAADVLHSWTLPNIAVKADAVPGRVNKLNLIPKRPGIYYGQCREICGSNHSFIPISIECHLFNRAITLKVIIKKLRC